MRCKTDPPVGADCGCSRRGGGSGGVGNWRGGGGAEDVRRDVDDVLVLHILDIFRGTEPGTFDDPFDGLLCTNLQYKPCFPN